MEFPDGYYYGYCSVLTVCLHFRDCKVHVLCPHTDWNGSTVHYNYSEFVKSVTTHITEARLKRDVAEGKIVDFWRTDRGYEVIRLEALNGRENKVTILTVL